LASCGQYVFVLVQGASGGGGGAAMLPIRATLSLNVCPAKPKDTARGSDASSVTVSPPSESFGAAAAAAAVAAATGRSVASTARAQRAAIATSFRRPALLRRLRLRSATLSR
jgi:hypothetical protein